MGISVILPLFAVMSHLVVQDRSPVREGCALEDRVIAYLNWGEPVAIQFAIAGATGTCYKVSAGALVGYVSAAAVSGLDQFERARRDAPALVSRAGSEIIRYGAHAGPRAAQLLEQNKPAEALEVLESSLKTAGNDAGLLSMAGYAAYRGDDMARAMDYLKRSLAIQPNHSVERLYQLVEREAREDKSGEKLAGARFLLRYSRSQMNSATARELIAVLDQEFSRISSELGCEASERIVAVVQTPEEYRRTTAAAEWSGGQYNGRIRVAALDQSKLDESTRRTFSHEIVHACMAGLGDFPEWLHEGLAQKLSGEALDAEQSAAVRRMARAGQLPKLENLGQTWSRLSTSHARIAYDTALAATELLYEHHSALGARNLLRNAHLLPQIGADLDRLLRE